MKKFALIDEAEGQEMIRNIDEQMNVFFLASSGFGVRSSIRELAEKVVEFLNSLPDEETRIL